MIVGNSVFALKNIVTGEYLSDITDYRLTFDKINRRIWNKIGYLQASLKRYNSRQYLPEDLVIVEISLDNGNVKEVLHIEDSPKFTTKNMAILKKIL